MVVAEFIEGIDYLFSADVAGVGHFAQPLSFLLRWILHYFLNKIPIHSLVHWKASEAIPE